MSDPCDEIVEVIETEQEMKDALFDKDEIIVSCKVIFFDSII